jgi:tripartite-type tricarboxylate transporter receptor subunit TctC
MAGTTMASLVDTGPATGLIKAGKVRAIAITAAARTADFPDVATATEAGYPEMSISFWSAMFAPAAVPPAIVKKLGAELQRIVKLPEIQERMKKLAVIPEGASGDAACRFIANEIATYAEVARAANITRE